VEMAQLRGSKKMAFEVEVLKIDFPEIEGASVITCKVETKENGEKIYRNVEVVKDGKLVLKFTPASPTSHKTTLAFQIASKKGNNLSRCMSPLNLSNAASTEFSGKELLSDSHVRLLHFSAPLVDTNMEQIKGTMWFRVNTCQAKSVNQLRSHLKGIHLSEQRSSCSYSCALRPHPVVFILFNTVSMEKRVSSTNISPVALVDETPVENATAILNKTGKEIEVVPIFKPIALKCQSKDKVVQLHLVTESDPKPQFSISIPLPNLQPFKSYNWKFDQKWTKTSFQCNPSEGKLNNDTGVTSSLVYFPPSSEYSSYEGLEIFVEIPILESIEKDNLIVSLQLEKKKLPSAGSAQANSSSDQGRDTANVEYGDETSVAVMQSWEGGSFLSSPAYFFISCNQKIYEGCKAHLRFYSSALKNTKPWWDSDKHSSVVVYFTSELMNDLVSPANKHGLKLKFIEDGIEHSSQNSALFQELNAVVRWKTKDMNFLSEMLSIPKTKSAEHLSEENSSPKSLSAQHFSGTAKLSSPTLEVDKLQRENDLLRKENKDFEKFIIDMEASIISAATEKSQLQVLTKFDLIQNVIRLSDLLLKEKEIRIKCQAKIRKMQDLLARYRQTESDFLELQKAHVSQQHLVRQLQEKVVKYKKSIYICKQQDMTITNLEKVLCEKSVDIKRKGVLAELKRENAYLRSLVPINVDHEGSLLAEKEKTIVALQREVSELSKKARKFQLTSRLDLAFEGSGHKATTYQREKDRYKDLKQQLAIAEIRERVAMKELLASRGQRSKQLRIPDKHDRRMLQQDKDSPFYLHESQDNLWHWPRDAKLYRRGVSYPHRSYSPDFSQTSSRSSILPESLPPPKHNKGFYSSLSTPSSSYVRR